jgi:inorganic pyrophosphatase
VINAVVEVPGGQANKYEYDKTLHVVRLDRPLYASVHYPGEYGFIPSTLADDDDPLDILVLLPDPTFVGCLIQARPVGVLEMLDQQIPDQKILAVALGVSPDVEAGVPPAGFSVQLVFASGRMPGFTAGETPASTPQATH